MPFITDELDKQGQQTRNTQGAQSGGDTGQSQQQQPFLGSSAGTAFAGGSGGVSQDKTAGQGGTGGNGQPFTNVQDYLKANPTGAQKLEGYVNGQTSKLSGYLDNYQNKSNDYANKVTGFEGANKQNADTLSNLRSEYAAYNPYQNAGNQFGSPAHSRYQTNPTAPSGGFQNDYDYAQNAIQNSNSPGNFQYQSELPADVKSMDFSTPDKTEQTAHSYYGQQGIGMAPGASVLQDQFDLSDPGLARANNQFTSFSNTYNSLIDPNSQYGYVPPGGSGVAINPNGVRALNEREQLAENSANSNRTAWDKFNQDKSGYETAAGAKNYDIFGRDAGNNVNGPRYSLNDLENMTYNLGARDQNYNMAGDPAGQAAAYENLRQSLLKANGFGG